MASRVLNFEDGLEAPAQAETHARVWSDKLERIGLGSAIALHLAVITVLVIDYGWDQPEAREARMTVSLASEVSLENAGPRIVEESRAAIAPTLSDEPEAPVEEQAAEAEPVRTSPAPPANTPARPTATTRTEAPPRNRSRPDRTPARESAAPTPKKASGSRIGDDFLSGKGTSTATDETAAPAATFGRAERAALASAITRQLRPHWNAPTGVDAEKLVSVVSWRLNEDGSLAGRPRCRTQPSSITDSNRPQAGLHCERAIRAVQLAAPFNLPGQFYSRWDDLEWQFDRRL